MYVCDPLVQSHSCVCVCACVFPLFRKSNCSNVALVFARVLVVALLLYLHVSVSFEPNLFSCLSASLGVCSCFLSFSLLAFLLSGVSLVSNTCWGVEETIGTPRIDMISCYSYSSSSLSVQVKKKQDERLRSERNKQICAVSVRVSFFLFFFADALLRK